ncbi:uncharacterized protein EKO05_0010659 [Ascochyta rabiei]|uniref:uncharacterized protein n=1 Tax=Didymella rabiei TaxID=5454 RepID=UPI0021FC6C7F|nr:uncharacterized protein EKO05_0010659 [Ascochyta rabiei]UPX20428.1 hypothetical protein EKO05_0010659 [Ascochyta rabiei]
MGVEPLTEDQLAEGKTFVEVQAKDAKYIAACDRLRTVGLEAYHIVGVRFRPSRKRPLQSCIAGPIPQDSGRNKEAVADQGNYEEEDKGDNDEKGSEPEDNNRYSSRVSRQKNAWAKREFDRMFTGPE